MKVVIMVLTVTLSVSVLLPAIHGRSSFLNTVEDHYLVGHVRYRQKMSSALSCAQLCLRNRPLCRSLNYGKSEGNVICELNDEGIDSAITGVSSLVSMPGFIFVQLVNLEHFKSCDEMQRKYPGATSGVYKIHPLSSADPLEVYCELNIAGGGFSFLPPSLTLRSDAQQIVNALFKDKKNVLLKLQRKDDGSEWYTLIQPHPNYANTDFGVLVNSYSGYKQPKNDFMREYIFLGILPKSVARNRNIQGFKSNGHVIQFTNCDADPNSLFAFFPNRNHRTPSGYAKGSPYEDRGVAVDWRSKAEPITTSNQIMPNKFFFLTEVHFGGCGCYTSSNRWKKFGFNSTAIGIR